MIKLKNKNDLNICILGSTGITDTAIKSLIEKKFVPKLVLTNIKDNYNSDWVDFKKNYKNLNCHSLKPNNENKIKNYLKKYKINLLFCIGWSHVLSKKIINIPNLIIIGHHPSELPLNRGKHPLIWSIFLGLKSTASSFFVMDYGIDTGKIIDQKRINIKKNSSVLHLYKSVQKAVSLQIVKISNNIRNNSLNKLYIRKQKKISKSSNYWRKRHQEDGKIDFRMNSQSILNLINSLSKPYAGAHIEIKNKKYKVWKAKIVKNNKDNNVEPGKIIKKNNNLLTIKTYDSAIKLIKHELILKNKIKYLI